MLVPCSWTSQNRQPNIFLSLNQFLCHLLTAAQNGLRQLLLCIPSVYKQIARDSSINSMTHPFFQNDIYSYNYMYFIFMK